MPAKRASLLIFASLAGCAPSPAPLPPAPAASSAPAPAGSKPAPRAEPAFDPEAFACSRGLPSGGEEKKVSPLVTFEVAPATGRGKPPGDLGEISVQIGGKVRPITAMDVGLPPPPSAQIEGQLPPAVRPLWARFEGLRERSRRHDLLRLGVERSVIPTGDEGRCLRELQQKLAQSRVEERASIAGAQEALVATLRGAPEGAARSFLLAYLGADYEREEPLDREGMAHLRRAVEAEPPGSALGAYARLWGGELSAQEESKKWLREAVEQQRDPALLDTARLRLAARTQGEEAAELLRAAAQGSAPDAAGRRQVALWRLAAVEAELGRWEPSLRAAERFAQGQAELDRNFTADIAQQIVQALALAPAEARLSVSLPALILHSVAEQLADPASGAPLSTARAALAATPGSTLPKIKATLASLSAADAARDSLRRLLVRCAVARGDPAVSAAQLTISFDGKKIAARSAPPAPKLTRCLQEQAAYLVPSGSLSAKARLAWSARAQ